MSENKVQVVQSTDVFRAEVAAELDTQVSTAKRYPRDLERVRKNIRDILCASVEMAEECTYSIPRAGKNIEGPSIRFAEVVGAEFGNLRVQATVMGEDNKSVLAKGRCWNLESNYAEEKDVRRGIVGKDGRRFREDVVNTTYLAALAIAKRDAVLGAVPRAFWFPLYLETRELAGSGGDLAKRRHQALSWFESRGVSEEDVLRVLGVQKRGDIRGDQLVTLRGIVNAIRSDETSIDEVFGGGKPGLSQKSAYQKQSPTQATKGAGPKKSLKKGEETEGGDLPGSGPTTKELIKEAKELIKKKTVPDMTVSEMMAECNLTGLEEIEGAAAIQKFLDLLKDY